MGVYLPNMEMPKPKLADMATIYNAYILVDPNGRAAIVVDNEDGLDSTEYSLVPVPKHGRCIDADALVRELNSIRASFGSANGLVEGGLNIAVSTVNGRPTIIQAEEVE